MKRYYQPSQEILKKYADVLVNFGLGNGKGIKKGDIVRITCAEFAKPLYIELHRAVITAGGHVFPNYSPNNNRKDFNPVRDFFEFASDEQLRFFPKKYWKALADTIDHAISIFADVDKRSLAGVDPKKMMLHGESRKEIRMWLNAKEQKGKFSWTAALYGTPDGAREAGLSYEVYWKEIIKACYLDKKDPVAAWRKIARDMDRVGNWLNDLPISKLHIMGPDADLWIGLGEKRKWIWGGGSNIPSFEIFTSPDCRQTEGWIRFNQPLYRYGNLITDIELTFKGGCVVSSKARKNYAVLRDMIATPGADMVGEFSLTDKRFSKITQFMAETLFDENVGGANGNTHIALGNAYREAYAEDRTQLSQAQWKKLGFNSSSVHTDIISTAPRTVTAHMKDGSQKIIYRNGMFTV